MQTEPITRTHYGFETQFSEHYTKAVFNEFRTKLKKSTLFRVKANRDPSVDENNYLVTYHEPNDTFSWSNHEFKVVANPVKGEYTCECKLFEHTGTNRSPRKKLFNYRQLHQHNVCFPVYKMVKLTVFSITQKLPFC